MSDDLKNWEPTHLKYACKVALAMFAAAILAAVLASVL